MHSTRVPKQQCSNNKNVIMPHRNKVKDGKYPKATDQISTIRASTFVVFESRRSSRSLIIFILVGASLQPDKNLKIRAKI